MGYIRKFVQALYEKNFFSLKLYLETLIEDPLWETEDTDELLHRFSLMEDLIVSSTLTDSVKTLYQTRKLLTAQEAVRLLKDSLLEPLRQKTSLSSI